MKIINKQDLINLGFPKHTAQNIIRQAKFNMIQQGYAIYNNKRLGQVPIQSVEAILGFSLSNNNEESNNG